MYGRRALYFIVSVVLFILIVVFAVYVVFMKFRPETEIQRMLRAMSRVETVRERSAVSWTSGEGKDRTTVSTYLVGQVDLSALPEIQQVTKFRTFQINRSKAYGDLSGELRTIDGTSYLSISSKDEWVSFADGELAKYGDVIPGARVPALTDEAILRLRELLSVADVLMVRYDDVTEIVEQHATRVIEARFEPDATRALLLDVVRAKENREPTDAERVVVESQASDLERLAVRLWIGIDDHLLYRFQAAGVSQTSPCPSPCEGEGSVSIDVLINLFDYDVPFDGEMPSPKRTTGFSSIYNAMIGSLESSGNAIPSPSQGEGQGEVYGRLPVETTTKSDDADGDGLSAIVEAFYQTNPNVADTDGDGKSDGEEVLSGKNPNGSGSLFGFGLGQ